MQCPFCQTENREDRERCYACDKDISMLRLITNKARQHYNVALEHAERGRTVEAIDELKNAIDLDRRFGPAHVVLGTLYAKQQQFEEARDAWDAALSINPELAKAHRYLEKIGPVERELPFLANLRRIVWAAGIVLFILVVALGFALRQPAGAKSLRRADTALGRGDYGVAMRQAELARREARTGSAIESAAGALEAAVRLDFDQQIRQIQELKYRSDYPNAIRSVEALESRHPDLATSSVLSNLREDLAHYYRLDVQDKLRRFQSGELSFEELAAELRQFDQIYPQLPGSTELKDALDSARDAEIQRRANGILARYSSDGDLGAVRAELRRLAADFPHVQAAERAREDVVGALHNSLFDSFDERLDAQDFPVAREILDRISELATETSDVVNVRGPLDLAARAQADAMRTAELRDAEALVRSGQDIPAAYAALELLESDDSLTTAERAAVEKLQTTLEQRDLQLRLGALRERRGDLMAGRLAANETTGILAEADAVAQLATEPHDQAEAHLFAAAAAATLGNRELAARHLASARAADEGVVTRAQGEAIMRLAGRKAGVSIEPAGAGGAGTGGRAGRRNQ